MTAILFCAALCALVAAAVAECGGGAYPEHCSHTMSDEMAATGNRCLKLDYLQNTDGAWWMNSFVLCSPGGVVPDIPLISVTVRMKVYRTLGDTECTLLHASLQNSTPRTFDDSGWQQVTGRFGEIVI